MRPALILSCLLIAGPALAAPAPKPAPPPKAALPKSELPKPPAPKPAAKPLTDDQLFQQLAKADSAEDAHPIEQNLLTRFKSSGSPSVDLLMNRAEVAQAAGDNKMARKLLGAVTRIAPGFAEGWHARAALENEDGDDTSALISLQKTVALNPRHFAALNELGGMLEDYGDKAGALKLYRRALALDPQMDDAQRHVKALTRSVEGQEI